MSAYLHAITVRVNWTTIAVYEAPFVRTFISVIWYAIIVRVGGAKVSWNSDGALVQAVTGVVHLHLVDVGTNEDLLSIGRYIDGITKVCIAGGVDIDLCFPLPFRRRASHLELV